MTGFDNDIRGTINADELVLGVGVTVEAGVVITGNRGQKCKKVVLGDFCYIGRETRVYAPQFRLGEYSKWHNFGLGKGALPLQIGRCCWIGGNTVLDSMGGLDIADNVGIGAHSQVWTHAQFGDLVEGCRFLSHKYMHLGKDAWFVGHCVVSPVRVESRSMALVGSVVTRDMQENHVYGGSPAVDLTAKVGPQFEHRTVSQKADALAGLIAAFEQANPEHIDQLHVATSPNEIRDDARTWFDVSRRVYTKRRSPAEVAFLRANVPLIKFSPLGEPQFVVPQQDLA